MAKDRFKYAYDRTSNRVSRDTVADSDTPPDANDNYYTYDGLDRLTKSNRGTLDVNCVITDQNADANQAWTLCPVGNWTQFKWDDDGGGAGTPTVQARTHNTANEIQAISGTNANWVDPVYDLAGNMTKGPQPGHEAEDANTQWYAYDAWNRLVTVSRGSSSPGTLVVTYRYDGQNRRIRKYLPPNEEDRRLTTEYYYSLDWRVLEVRRDLEVIPFEESPPEPPVVNKLYEQYVWGEQYIDAPVVRFRDTDSDGEVDDETLYYTYDGNFNVTALVEPDGDVLERYAYDPYGKVTIYEGDWSDTRPSSNYANEILYCGYRFDPESGLYHVNHRYLHPTLGRWITRDRIGYGDGMNGYQYVGGRPVGFVDALGLAMFSTAEFMDADLASAFAPRAAPSYFRVGVFNDKGIYVGHMTIDKFTRINGLNYDLLTGEPAVYGGVHIEGGFDATGDLTRWPNCCKEMRWSQLIVKARQKGSVNRNREGKFDGWDNKVRQKTPFYHSNEERTGDFPGILILAGTENDPWYYGNHEGKRGYTIDFSDSPRCPRELWPCEYEFKLCLLCVHHRPGPELFSLPGRATVYACITYGYKIEENRHSLERQGLLTLRKPVDTPDKTLPGESVGWGLE